MITQKQLIELGLSPKETVVYLALLELGPSTASEVARRAKINRTTSYDILESLVGDRLVSAVGETKVQQYAAESPEKVLTLLERRISEAQARLKAAQVLLPQLLSVYSRKQKPRVKFYEGNDGVKEAFEDSLNAKGELMAYAVGDDMTTSIPLKYFQDYFRRRTARGIRVRVIAPDDAGSRAVVANDKSELRTSVLVPKERFHFSVEVNIYNNTVLMVSWREKFAIIIESEQIADMQKKSFELAWEGAKRISATNFDR
jgi:sugar-specific transcriptional regulator TrmB